jgi:hypothetical protein
MQSRTLLLGALLIAAAVVIVALAKDDEGASAPALSSPESSESGAAPDPGSATVEAPTSPTRSEALPGTAGSALPPTGFLLTCRRADDGRPLAGISVFQDGAMTGGPSTDAGELRLEAPAWERRILWKAGFIARRLDGPELPSEVLFEAADAELDLSLRNGGPEHRVVRTLLEQRGGNSPPNGPWKPRLKVESWDRLIARDVPPGTYDVYVWISKGDGAAQAYSLRGVHLPAGQRTRLSLDLVADALATNESDS